MLFLYGVTDQAFTGEKTLTEQIEEALSAGVTLLQLREKGLDKRAFLEEALLVRELTKHYGVPLIINDDVEIALRCGADGVHVGQDDLSPSEVRRLIGPDRILGVTAKNVSQAKNAFMDGADYIGSGAIFPSLARTSRPSISGMRRSTRTRSGRLSRNTSSPRRPSGASNTVKPRFSI